MWNPRAFRPEIKNRLLFACFASVASLGAGVCGPSGGDSATLLAEISE